MRKLLGDSRAQLDIIFTAIIVVVVFAIGLIIIFNVFAAMDLDELDDEFDALGSSQGYNTTLYTPVTNATNNVLDNIQVFFTVGPIIIIVIAAVGILSYVLILRNR